MKIYGKETLVNYINKAVGHDKVSHAYIFTGPKGVGKKTLADYFAKRLLCETKEPGCRCSSCVLFEAGNNPDLFYVVPSKTMLGVEEIRDIAEHMAVRPYRFAKKVFVIRDGDIMTVQAQNALLKTLEEPASYGVILIVAENTGNLLDTIKSRAITLRVPSASEDVMREFLSDKGVTEREAQDTAVHYSAGILGQGLDMALSEEFKEIRQAMLDILENIMTMDVTTLFNTAKTLETYKNNIASCFRVLSFFFRDALLYKDKSTRHFVTEHERLYLVKRYGEQVTYEKLCDILKTIEDTRLKIKENTNFRLCIDLLLLKIKENTYDRNRGNTI